MTTLNQLFSEQCPEFAHIVREENHIHIIVEPAVPLAVFFLTISLASAAALIALFIYSLLTATEEMLLAAGGMYLILALSLLFVGPWFFHSLKQKTHIRVNRQTGDFEMFEGHSMPLVFHKSSAVPVLDRGQLVVYPDEAAANSKSEYNCFIMNLAGRHEWVSQLIAALQNTSAGELEACCPFELENVPLSPEQLDMKQETARKESSHAE